MCNDTEKLWCETCGEAEQEIHLMNAGLCGDCFAAAAREAVGDGLDLGYLPCCHPFFIDGKLAGLCLTECGTEHAHGVIKGG